MCLAKKQRVGAALLGMLLINMLSQSQVTAGIYRGCAWRHTLYSRSTIINQLSVPEFKLDEVISACRFVREVSDKNTTYRVTYNWWNLIDGLSELKPFEGVEGETKVTLTMAMFIIDLALLKVCGHPDQVKELAGILPFGVGGTIGVLRKVCNFFDETIDAARAVSYVPVAPVKAAANTYKRGVSPIKKVCSSSVGGMEGLCPKGNWVLRAIMLFKKMWSITKFIWLFLDKVVFPSISVGFCRDYSDMFKKYEAQFPGLAIHSSYENGCDPLPDGSSDLMSAAMSADLISPAGTTGNAGLDKFVGILVDIKKAVEDLTKVVEPLATPLNEVGEWADKLTGLLNKVWAPLKPFQGVLDTLSGVLGFVKCPGFLGAICNLDELIIGFVDDLLEKLGIPNLTDLVNTVLEALGLGFITDELDKLKEFAKRFDFLDDLKQSFDGLTNTVKGKVLELKNLMFDLDAFATPVPKPYPDPRFPGNIVYQITVSVRNPKSNPPPTFSCEGYQGIPLMVTASRQVQDCDMPLAAVLRYPCNLEKSCTVDVTQFEPACPDLPPVLTPEEVKELADYFEQPDFQLPVHDVFEARYMCIDLNDPVVKENFQLLAELLTVTGEPDRTVRQSWEYRVPGIRAQNNVTALVDVNPASASSNDKYGTDLYGVWNDRYTVTGVPMRDFVPKLIRFNADFPGFIDCGSNGNRVIWIEAANNPAAFSEEPVKVNDLDTVDMSIQYPEKFDPCFSKEWLSSQDEEALTLKLPDGQVVSPSDITSDAEMVPKMKRDLCDWVWRLKDSIKMIVNGTFIGSIDSVDANKFPAYNPFREDRYSPIDTVTMLQNGDVLQLPPERSMHPWINKHATFYRLTFREKGPTGALCPDPRDSIFLFKPVVCVDDYAVFNNLMDCIEFHNIDEGLVTAFRDMYPSALDPNWVESGGYSTDYDIICEQAADVTISQWVKLSGAGGLTTQLATENGPWHPWAGHDHAGGSLVLNAYNGSLHWTDADMKVDERNKEGMLRKMVVQSYRGTDGDGTTVTSPESIKKCADAIKAITDNCHGKQYCDIDSGCMPGVIQYSCMEDEVFNPIGYHTRIGYHFGDSVNAGEKRNVSCVNLDNFAYIAKADLGSAVENSDVTEAAVANTVCEGPTCFITVKDVVPEGAQFNDQILRVEIGCICGPGKLPAMKTDGSCNLCPAGKYRDRIMPDCDLCPAGTYSDAGATGCTTCPAGYYSARGAIVCSVCDPGTMSAIGATECTPCAADTYAASNASAACELCPPGLTTKGEPKSIGCTACPSGWTRDNEPEFETGCRPCPAGTFMSNMTGVVKCTPCMPGYSQPSQAALQCLPCNPGSYQPSVGQASCKVCPSGKIALSSGSTNCTDPPVKAVVDWDAASRLWVEQWQRNSSGGGRRLLSGAPPAPAKSVGSLCDAWLASVGNLTGSTAEARVSQLGNGWCNRGPWNVEICKYDGGDCCAATCQRAVMNSTEDDGAGANGTSTNITSNGTDSVNATSYVPVSCRPDTFECKDPNGKGAGGWTRLELPGSIDPSQANDTCDQTDKRLGDGLCQGDLNIKACNYDKGDCCYSTCKPNPLVPASCGVIDCRDPIAIAGKWVDTVAPRLMGVPVNLTVYLGTLRWREALKTPVVTANDNDLSFDGNVTFSEVAKAGTGNTVNTITRTWTAKDPSGNTAKLVQLITVLKSDPSAPTFKGVPANMNMTCAQAAAGVPDTPVTAAVGGQPVKVVLDTDMAPGRCGGTYTLTHTWTARTSDGLHEAGATQLIQVIDDQGPALPNSTEGAVVACFRKKKFKMAEFPGISKAGNFSFDEVVDDCSPASGISSKGFVSCGPAPGLTIKPVKGMPNCTYVPSSDTLYVPYLSAYNITVHTLPSGKNKTVKATVPMVFSVAWAFEDGCGNVGVVTQRLIAPRTVKDLPPGMPFTGCTYTSVNAVPASNGTAANITAGRR